MITKLILIVVVNNLRMLKMYAYNIYTNNNTQSLVVKVYLFGFKYEHYSMTQWFRFNQLRFKELKETFSVLQIYCPNNNNNI